MNDIFGTLMLGLYANTWLLIQVWSNFDNLNLEIQLIVGGLNTDAPFTTAISNSFPSLLEKNPKAAELG